MKSSFSTQGKLDCLNILIIRTADENEQRCCCEHRMSVYNKGNLRISEYIVFPEDKGIGICGERFNIVLIDEHLPFELYHDCLNQGYANICPRLTITFNPLDEYEEMNLYSEKLFSDS